MHVLPNEKYSDAGYINCQEVVTKGYYLHRGTKSSYFRSKWTDEKLLKIAYELYKEYENKL